MIIAVNPNLSNWNKEAWKKIQGFNGNFFFFFQASLFQLLKLGFTAMIIYHFHIHPQFIYELFHIHYIIIIVIILFDM